MRSWERVASSRSRTRSSIATHVGLDHRACKDAQGDCRTQRTGGRHWKHHSCVTFPHWPTGPARQSEEGGSRGGCPKSCLFLLSSGMFSAFCGLLLGCFPPFGLFHGVFPWRRGGPRRPQTTSATKRRTPRAASEMTSAIARASNGEDYLGNSLPRSGGFFSHCRCGNFDRLFQFSHSASAVFLAHTCLSALVLLGEARFLERWKTCSAQAQTRR